MQRFSTNFGVFSFFFDIIIGFGTLHLTQIIRPALSRLPIVRPMLQIPELPIVIYFLFPLLWVLFLLAFSAYDGKKNLRITDEFTNITLGSLFAAITLAGVLYISHRDISRFLYILFVTLNYLSLISWRTVARKLYDRRIEQKDYKKRILIIGAGPLGLNLRSRLMQLGSETFEFVGFLDDSVEKQKIRQDVIEGIDQIREIVLKHRIDIVIISLPLSAHERTDYIIKQLEKLAVEISVVPDYFQLTLHQMKLSEFEGIPMLNLRSAALTEHQRLVKRIFDVVLTSIFMIPAFPIMFIISTMIIIFDGFPVLFKQNRVGENGRIINMLKFRTMVRDAEKHFPILKGKNSDGEIIYKRKDDPRVTPLGRILRRWSLDELPQLINILRGTMSLVGPRPEIPALVNDYQTWQRVRLTVPQGLTGWWQVQGRSDKPLHLNVEEDIYYIEHYSIWFDMMIIIKTVWIVLRGKGAY